LKSSQSPSSGRPYDGHLFQLAAYCLLVEDVCRVSVPYGLVKYQDRTIRVEYTPSLRASLITLLDEIRTAKRNGECHINHNQPSKCRSCGFSSVCGEGLI
jgi:CRISPR-associated exonuclease Cas4